MHGLDFDIAHMLAGGLVLVSFMMLYQDRLYALINVLALHAFVLALSVAWQAYIQRRAASLHHRGHRARLQGDHHPGGAASHGVPPRHPSRDRNGRQHRPDDARRHRRWWRCRSRSCCR